MEQCEAALFQELVRNTIALCDVGRAFVNVRFKNLKRLDDPSFFRRCHLLYREENDTVRFAPRRRATDVESLTAKILPMADYNPFFWKSMGGFSSCN